MEKEIDKNNLPKHLAIIMDGNGRWAKKQGMLRVFGHEKGTKSVKQTVENCAKLGIEFLTLYAFSTENWNRPKIEVDTLMKLLISALKKELKTLQENNIKLNAIGNLDSLPSGVKKNTALPPLRPFTRVVPTVASRLIVLAFANVSINTELSTGISSLISGGACDKIIGFAVVEFANE